MYLEKGQSAVEYLMTYGWMLLVVAVVSGAVFSVVGNPSIESVSGFSSEDILIQDFGVSSNNELSLEVSDGSGQGVTVIKMIIEDSETGNNIVKEFTGDTEVSTGESRIFELPNVTRSDSNNNLDIEVLYNSEGLSNLSAKGYISGDFSVNEDIFVSGPAVEEASGLTGPVADFSRNITSPLTGDKIEFDASSSSEGDGSIIEYKWDFDDDGDYEYAGENKSVIHSYDTTGSKSVMLNVTDNNGLQDISEMSFDVSAPVTAPSNGGEWSHVEPAGAEGAYDYFFNTSTTPYGTTYGGNSSVQYTEDGYYIMKYQAANDGSNVPVSNGDSPWKGLPFNNQGGSPNVVEVCETLDDQTDGYEIHATTNREWMTAARQIAQNPNNWADNSIGSSGTTGGLYQGNRDLGSNYDRALDFTSDDYIGAKKYGNPASEGGDEVRTHELASGDVVWDMSGDVLMFVDAEEDGTAMSSPDPSTSKIYEVGPYSSQVQGGAGLGTNIGVNDGNALARGGNWGSEERAGIFYARSQGPQYGNDVYGFRCSAIPIS